MAAPIFSYIRSFALSMTQRVVPNTSPSFIPDPEQDLSFRPQTVFPRPEQPLVLEIGCGIGDFILPLATSRPDVNFLAIDIYNQGCLKTCRKIDAAGRDNVRVMRIEARHLIARYLDPWSLAAIYINCPDPWPKKRHRERRLVNADFLEVVRFALKPGGELFFASDVADYAEEVSALIVAQCGFIRLTPEPYCIELQPDYPISKYMRRFLELGQPIHFVRLRRQNNEVEPPQTRPSAVRAGFRVRRETIGK